MNIDKKKIDAIRNIENAVMNLRNEVQNAQKALIETINTINALNQYKTLECDSESFIALGRGILAKSTLKKNGTVYADLGGIIVEKSIDDAIKMTEEKQKIIRNNISEFEKGISEMEKQYTFMLKEVQKQGVK